jgi:hypothetical protein
MDKNTFEFTDQLFVAIRGNSVLDVDNPPLGWAIPYKVKKDGEPYASTVKRIRTVMGWGDKSYYDNGVIKDVPAKTFFVDNVPRTGFKLLDVISRWSTENKVFDVLDPQGFKLQIYTGNLMDLINKTTIIKGVIQEPLMWADNGHLVTKSDYEVAKEYQATEYIKWQTLNGGAIFLLEDSDIEFTWFGRFHSLSRKTHNISASGDRFLGWRSAKRNFFGYMSDGKWRILEDTKPLKIVKVIKNEPYEADMASWLNQYITVDRWDDTVYVADKKGDLNIRFEPVDISNVRLENGFVRVSDTIAYAVKIYSYYVGQRDYRLYSVNTQKRAIMLEPKDFVRTMFTEVYEVYVNGKKIFEPHVR